MDPQLPRDPRGVAALLRELAPQPPANPADVGPWDFLDRLSDVAKEQLVRPALHELLSDRDALARRRAIEALTNLPESADTLTHLLAAARSHSGGGEIGDSLQHALSTYAIGSRRGREVSDAILKLAGGALPVTSAITVVGRFDPARSIAIAKKHSPQSSDARPWTSLAMAVGMYHRDDLIALLGALSSLPDSSKREVLADVQKTLASSEAHFQGWAAQDGVPGPQKAKPTLDECHAALALV